MQIKSKKILVILLFLSFFAINSTLNAEEFNISAKEIKIDKENETIEGIGSVQATDTEGKIIYADKVFYEKSKKFLLAIGNVKIADKEGNILETDARFLVLVHSKDPRKKRQKGALPRTRLASGPNMADG